MFKRFIHSESGAVTTDWVVMTAAAIGLVMAAYVVIGDSVNRVVAQVVGWVMAAETCNAGGSVTVVIGNTISQIC